MHPPKPFIYAGLEFRDSLSLGKVLRRKFFFTNTIDGFNNLMRQTKFYQKKENLPKSLFGMEPSGYYWIQLYEHLTESRKKVVTVSPLAVNRNRETINVSKDKSDPKDAYNIADLMRQGKFYLPIYRDKQMRQLKRLMQIYYRLIAQRASLRCRLRGVVGYIFPELERYFTDITAKSMIIILEDSPFPLEIKKMEKSDFVSFLLGRNPRLSRKRAEEIFKLAHLSVGITGEEKVVSLEIELLLDELKRIEKSIDKINSEAKAIVEEREEYPLLISIPGVGPITASSIIAEIGDITNFSSGKQLIKLAGLDLYGSESGISIHSLRHISKRGRRTLRTVVYQAVINCIRCNAHLKACYLKLLANQPNKKKVKRKAIVAIACKLLRIIYRMLTEKRAFDPNYDRKLKGRFSLRLTRINFEERLVL
ncbi:IS110 family transposase, partial [Candidatus Aerophobetes bacterium]